MCAQQHRAYTDISTVTGFPDLGLTRRAVTFAIAHDVRGLPLASVSCIAIDDGRILDIQRKREAKCITRTIWHPPIRAADS